MLKEIISFVYQDKKGNISKRTLTNYSIVKKDDVIYITGQDALRGNAIRKFIRSRILSVNPIEDFFNDKKFTVFSKKVKRAV